jgi:hypothetical protein
MRPFDHVVRIRDTSFQLQATLDNRCILAESAELISGGAFAPLTVSPARRVGAALPALSRFSV